MTMLIKDIARCGVCGKGNEVTVMTSTSRFGSCDLDTRPPAMFPFTIFLQHCEHCGYVAPKIAEGDSSMSAFVNSEMYQSCDGIEPASKSAKYYIRYALLQGYSRVATIWNNKETDSDLDKVFWGYLNAAWACDDMLYHKPQEDEPNYSRHKCTRDADECRKRCLDLIDTIIVNHKEQKEKETLLGIKADLLRRTCQFDSVIVEFEDRKLQDQYADQVIRFEVDRAREQDAARYSMDDVDPRKYPPR